MTAVPVAEMTIMTIWYPMSDVSRSKPTRVLAPMGMAFALTR